MTIKQDITRSVTEIELEHGVNAGIGLRSFGKGMIPVYEEHEVRIANKLLLAEWDELPYLERVILVAMSRIKRAISNLQSEAEIRNADINKRRK